MDDLPPSGVDSTFVTVLFVTLPLCIDAMSGTVTPTTPYDKSNSASPQVNPLHYPERRAVVVRQAPLRQVCE